jgi:hypothetical protein
MTYASSVWGPSLLSKVDGAKQIPSNSAFSQKCKRALSNAEFNQLLDKGFCQHTFPNQQTLLFAIRTASVSREHDVAIEAIDLERKELVGFRHFRIYEGKAFGKPIPAEGCGRLRIQSDFSPETWEVFRQAGIPNRDALIVTPTGDAAFWIKPGYRKQDKNGYNDFSHILMNTVIRIVNGLGIDTFEINEIGGRNPKARRPLTEYHSKEFGMLPVDGNPGKMIITL